MIGIVKKIHKVRHLKSDVCRINLACRVSVIFVIYIYQVWSD